MSEGMDMGLPWVWVWAWPALFSSVCAVQEEVCAHYQLQRQQEEQQVQGL